MVRFLGLGVMLLAAASTATAGEHYVETWNPPEARHALRADHKTIKPKVHKVAVHRAAKAKPRHVAAPAAKVARKAPAVGVATGDPAYQKLDIPRMTTPEGNVLRVGSHGDKVQVGR